MGKKENTPEMDQLSEGQKRKREALIKLGKYSAYTAPAMLVTTNAHRAFAKAAPGSDAERKVQSSDPTSTTTTTTTSTTTTTLPPTVESPYGPFGSRTLTLNSKDGNYYNAAGTLRYDPDADKHYRLHGSTKRWYAPMG